MGTGNHLLKVLTKDLKSPYQHFDFSAAVASGEILHCSDFDTSEKECSRGFYGTNIEGLPYAFRHRRESRVFEVEVAGKKAEFDIFKRRYENIKFVREVSYDEIKELAFAKEKKLGYKLSQIIFPINPFGMIKRTKGIPHGQMHELLIKWSTIRISIWQAIEATIEATIGTSVWDTAWDSAWDSVGISIRNTVRDSIWNTAWDTARDSRWNTARAFIDVSIWDSIGAYISSLFLQIKTWKYIKTEPGRNPFQSCIDLWNNGYVPSFDGKIWRLHTGEDANIVFELAEKDILS